ncbi:torsin-1A-like [Misgurnus anguillicaudatus]|uniref:torsin-1A-like n=1 Tax=Misgurnus anguillicaudatus TaxID=75329 RepID=UPI003CCFA905
MKSAKIFVLFILLPIATVEMQFFDFINVFFDKDVLRPFDAEEFKKDLRKSLYGQHIALEAIHKSVSGFMKDPNPSKPLVLSLHGSTGVGKTYVTKIIARNIYEMGEKSKHVHTFIATYHFPLKQHTETYKTQLKQWIHGSVSSFPRTMFIFDEVEKMDPHLIETIKPFLDYVPDVAGVSFHNAIFIFLSNAGQNVINNITLAFMREHKRRDDIQMYSMDMETKIYQYIFDNEDTGFRHSCLIGEHLVDHFIPFLPLELKHVRQCVLAEMANLNIPIAQYPDLADTVARQMPFFPPEENIFSVKGCKSVRQKLILYFKE